MHQFQSFGPQGPAVAEYAFPSVLQFLQSEWRRFERDRNEWDIEKAEMKVWMKIWPGDLYAGISLLSIPSPGRVQICVKDDVRLTQAMMKAVRHP